MTPTLFLAVAVAGGLGAAVRFLADESITRWLRTPALAKRFKHTQGWAIVIVNVTGSFLLGLLAGPLALVAWGRVVSVGFLGGYTTFSTASLNSVRIALDKGKTAGATYALATYLLSVLAAGLGLVLGALVF